MGSWDNETGEMDSDDTLINWNMFPCMKKMDILINLFRFCVFIYFSSF